MRDLTNDDIKFLADLRDEMRTQSTDGNCDPRFWTVIDTYREPCWSENAEYWFLVDPEDGETVGEVYYEIDAGELNCVPAHDVSRVVEETLFLTKKEAIAHIESNRHHYNKPRTYVQTAYRSPQVERLWEILRSIDWESLVCVEATREEKSNEKITA